MAYLSIGIFLSVHSWWRDQYQLWICSPYTLYNRERWKAPGTYLHLPTITPSSYHTFQLPHLPAIIPSSYHTFQLSYLPATTPSSYHTFQLSHLPAITPQRWHLLAITFFRYHTLRSKIFHVSHLVANVAKIFLWIGSYNSLWIGSYNSLWPTGPEIGGWLFLEEEYMGVWEGGRREKWEKCHLNWFVSVLTAKFLHW